MLDDKSVHTVQSLYLDFSKAFDLMRPDILATKLINNNASPHIIKLVLDFLTSRTQQVKSFGCLSSVRNTTIGVPQGTISGPSLWKIYVTDLKPAYKTLKYADDTTLYSKVLKSDIEVLENSGRNRLISIPDNDMQHAADRAVEWSQGNKQRLNASKTQYMMFSLQLNNKLHDSISIDGESIVQTESAKLLGVTIDQHLKFNSHIDTLIGKSRAAVHGLLTLKRKGVTPSMLTKYYQACIFPILTYASPAWHSHLSQNSKDKLERHQSLSETHSPNYAIIH